MTNTINILIFDDEANKISSLSRAFEGIQDEIQIESKPKIEFKIYPEPVDEINFARKITSLSSTTETLDELYSLIKSEVENNDIDILILDFYLNDESEISIDKTSGYSLLKKIREKNDRFSRIPIYSYTFAQDELDNAIGLITSGKIQGSVGKSNGNQLDELRFSKRTLYNIIFEANKYKTIEYSDVVVICALEEELEELLLVFGGKGSWEESDSNNKDITKKTSSYKKIYYDKNRDKVRIIATTEDTMGMAEAATLTTKMIEKYRPKYVVMTGIAAGIDRPKQEFLDILNPNQIFNWQAGKFKIIKESNENKHVLQREYEPQSATSISNMSLDDSEKKGIKKYHIDFLITYGFKIKECLEYKGEKQEDCLKQAIGEKIISVYSSIGADLEPFEELLKSLTISNEKKQDEEKVEKLISKIYNLVQNIAPRVHKEGMVSGSAVVADELISKENIGEQRNISGIDMEAYGVAYACNNTSLEDKPKVLIIKSVCDFADSEKDDFYHKMASYVSAKLFHLYFEKIYEVKEINL